MTLLNDSASSADETNTGLEAVAEAAPEITTDAPAESSLAPEVTEGAKPASLLDLVRNVVKDTQTEAPPAKETAEEKVSLNPDGTAKPGAPVAEATPDATGEAKPEDDEQLPFHKHPRFQALIRERNELKERATASTEKASQFDAISDYMADSNLTPDEVNRGFVIMSAIRNDPAKALEMLSETMAFLQGVTGETLPDDVVKLVDDGEMSEAAARELAKARAQIELQKHRQTQDVERQNAYQAQTAHNAIVGTVTNWETQIVARDPDYSAKRELVYQNIRLANLDNPPRNPAEALAIAEAAYAKANETMKSFLPKRVQIKAPVSGQSVAGAKPEPKSLRDVVRAAAAAAA